MKKLNKILTKFRKLQLAFWAIDSIRNDENKE